MKTKAVPKRTPADPQPAVWVIAGLLLAVLLVYWPVIGFDFVNFDDDAYVRDNPKVRTGVTVEGLRWAFTAVSYFYWKPLTWISHMVDCELFGLSPGPHHMVNVLLHALNSVLLFSALRLATGAFWRSAAVAAIFALHPTRVESVAWIAERKDVLSGLFWMLALIAYVRYAQSPSGKRYALVFAAMLGGVMSKPSIVPLPFVLLILDWWPLGRSARWQRLVAEKLPLFAISAGSSLVTYIGQDQMGATRLMGELPAAVRLSNAAVSYGWYVWTFFWPQGLSVLYPYRKEIPAAWLAGSVVLLAAATALAIWRARTQPYLLAGWLWFLGVLVPVIGLIQAGSQARADRFTYIPMIGLAIAVVWSASELLSRWRTRQTLALCLCLAAALAIASRVQTSYWKDSVTLFRRAVDVTTDNPVAQHNLAYALSQKGLYAEALPHYRQALLYNPSHAEGHYNLGRAQWSLVRAADALASMREAIRLRPAYAEAHFSLGSIALRSLDEQAAVNHYGEALRLKLPPEYAAEAYNDLGVIAARAGRMEDAESHFRAALALVPGYTKAQQNLAGAIAQRGRSIPGR